MLVARPAPMSPMTMMTVALAWSVAVAVSDRVVASPLAPITVLQLAPCRRWPPANNGTTIHADYIGESHFVIFQGGKWSADIFVSASMKASCVTYSQLSPILVASLTGKMSSTSKLVFKEQRFTAHPTG